MIEQARLLTLKTAYMMDTVGNKGARGEIAMIKVVAPNMACQVIDWAIQAHGAAGVCDDSRSPMPMRTARTLRLCRRSGRSASQCDREAGTGAAYGCRAVERGASADYAWLSNLCV